MKTFAFIDASNLFYGGEKSLGWKIDYRKLFAYLKEKYKIGKALYFGGVEIHDFVYNYQSEDSVPVKNLKNYLADLIKNKGQKLDEFGYNLFLKPVKMYDQEDGMTRRKANCDADMTFHLMKEKDNFDRVVILSGDGDF